MRNVTTLHDTQFIYFNCHHSKASKNSHAGFPLNWYIGSLDLLLHWSNVRRHSLKPPVRPKQWATKVRHKAIYHRMLSPPTPGEEVWLGQQDNINYIHAKVQVLSCHGSRYLRWKFGNCVKWSLFSHPITMIITLRRYVYLEILRYHFVMLWGKAWLMKKCWTLLVLQ